jgi:pimeloyl-ACP methyl ester carboxylesterase
MDKIVENHRTYGSAPYTVAVVHGGPGAAGEMAPVARALAHDRGIVEPLQTATSLEGQVEELRVTLTSYTALPVVLIGFSWGAWLSYIVAAQYPALVRKLLLVASGPFDQRYVTQLQETRLQRLNAQDQTEWHAISRALRDPAAADKDALLARLGVLAFMTDTYDPIVSVSEVAHTINPQGDIFQRVWATAAEWRRNGTLLELGTSIQCPVVALHGDYDPHPAAGVQRPLSALLKDFRFVLLQQGIRLGGNGRRGTAFTKPLSENWRESRRCANEPPPNTYEDPDCQETDYPSERVFAFFRFPGLGAVDGRSHVLT